MFDDIITQAADSWSVPESWIRAVIQVESGWNPNAYNPNDPDGARGLMQIIGPTARAYGIVDLSSLYDPVINIAVGTHLLSDLRNQYGNDFQRVYSAYNSGNPDLWQTSSEVAGNVARAMAALSEWSVDNPAASGGAGLLILALAWFLWRRFTK